MRSSLTLKGRGGTTAPAMSVTDSERPHREQTATFLGVSEATLRNWDREGKIAAHRNPINGYRLFKEADLEALLHQVERSGRHRGHRRRAR